MTPSAPIVIDVLVVLYKKPRAVTGAVPAVVTLPLRVAVVAVTALAAEETTVGEVLAGARTVTVRVAVPMFPLLSVAV